MKKDITGVSLIELAIVMVIVALLTGGVLAGKSLVKVTQINKLVSELNKTRLAYTNFVGKYNCKPGDCPNATTFFSAVDNGDGDGFIFNPGPSGWNPKFPSYTNLEGLEAWHHLAASGLLDISPTMDGNCLDFGDPIMYEQTFYTQCNYPMLPFDIGYFFISPQVQPVYFKKEFFCLNANVDCQSRVSDNIDVTTVREIDTKIDDGKPWRGKMLSANCSDAPDFDYFFDENPGYIAGYGSYIYDETKASCNSIISF